MKKKAESKRFYTFDPPLSNSGFTIYQNRNIAHSLLKTFKIHYLSKPSTGKGWGYGTANSFPPVVFNQGKPIFQWSGKFFSKGLWTWVNVLWGLICCLYPKHSLILSDIWTKCINQVHVFMLLRNKCERKSFDPKKHILKTSKACLPIGW